MKRPGSSLLSPRPAAVTTAKGCCGGARRTVPPNGDRSDAEAARPVPALGGHNGLLQFTTITAVRTDGSRIATAVPAKMVQSCPQGDRCSL